VTPGMHAGRRTLACPPARGRYPCQASPLRFHSARLDTPCQGFTTHRDRRKGAFRRTARLWRADAILLESGNDGLDTGPGRRQPEPEASGDTALAIIEARGLVRTFKSHKRTVEAVRGVDLTVGGGGTVGFLGPNGAGKTTTLRMLTTLLNPTAGTATVAGADLPRDPVGVRCLPHASPTPPPFHDQLIVDI